MHVIVVASQKGGAGKTTLAQCLAIEGLAEGRRVALIDADPQHTLAHWGERRLEAELQVPLVVTASGALAAQIADLDTQGADLVLIDTPPTASPTLSAALEVASTAILPTRPFMFDVEALEATVRVVQARRLEGMIVITQAPAERVRAMAAARDFLANLGMPLVDMGLSYSVSYSYAQARGLTVQETEPRGRARAELASVWSSAKRHRIV